LTDPRKSSPSAPPPPDDAEVLVEITGLAPGGDAVGRQEGGEGEGRVTFVPFAAPGERVRARLQRVRPRVAWAELTQIERPSPARVAPPCPLFGHCGGCQWQHVEDQVQRQAKGSFVSRALGLPVGDARAVGPAYGYRERARFSVGVDAQGRPAIGFHARRSHEIVDVPACPLLAPSLAAALPAVRRWAAEVPPADPASGEAPGVLVQAGRDGEVVARSGPRMARFRPEAEAEAEVEVEALDPRDPASWPDVSEVGGRSLRVPPGAFAQVGSAANAALVAAVAAAVGEAPGRVLELYAGSGNFTRLLVDRSADVIASDGDRQAVQRGRRAVPQARWYDAQALPSDAIDTVVVDPPREGLDARSLARAAAARRRLVYVSCDPQTLARDRHRLERRGFRLVAASAFDLMPQTHHVEVVALFVSPGARATSIDSTQLIPNA
jgi:23S rRNA (uracil1939-C5)-methyltransferase